MTITERESLAQLKGLLLGNNGHKGEIGRIKDDIAELRTELRPVIAWVTRQIDRETDDRRAAEAADRREAVTVAKGRLRLESDNVKWGLLFAIAGSPLLLRLLGLE